MYEILDGSDKIYTCLKIDEVNNLGAARIRIRSLIAAIRAKQAQNKKRTIKPASIEKVSFTKQMRKEYTISTSESLRLPLTHPATTWKSSQTTISTPLMWVLNM